MKAWSFDKWLLLGGVAYYLLAKFGMSLFALQPSNITLLWLPSGIGLLMCLRSSGQAIPIIILASLLANLPGMNLPSPGWQLFHTSIAASVDALESWLAAFLLRRHLSTNLARPVDLIRFIVLVCFIPTLVTAVLLTANLLVGDYIAWAGAAKMVVMLMVANSLGILLCYPLLQAWRDQAEFSSTDIGVWFVLAIVTTAIVEVAFTWLPAMIFLLVPLIVLLVFKAKPMDPLLTLLVSSCLIVGNASQDLGPFGLADTMQGRIMLIVFLFSTAITVTGVWLLQKSLNLNQQLINEQNIKLTQAREAALNNYEVTNNALQLKLEAYKEKLANASEREKSLAVEQAEVRERTHWMQEIHDGLGSHLIAARFAVEKASTLTGLQRVKDDIDDAIEELRELVESLSPEPSTIPATLGAMRYRLHTRFESAGVKLRWDVDPMIEASVVSAKVSLNVQRIAQEAMNNVLKHSRATVARIHMFTLGTTLIVRIEDDGLGFEANEKPPGKGLGNMQRRAAECGGDIQWLAMQPGTRVELTIPNH